MELKVFRSIDEIDSDFWDSVLPDDEIIKTHRFLKAVEHSNINNCKFWYVIFFKNAKVIANASLFSMDFYLDVIAPEFIKNICNNLRKVFPKFLRLKLLGCGTPVATCTNGISISENSYFKEVVTLLTKLILQIAKKEETHCILYKEYNQQESKAFDILLSMGFIKLHSLPTSFVDIYWKSWDEYFKNLRKKYRLFIKNDRIKLDSPKVTIEICEDFGAHADELWALYMNVYRKAEVKFEQLTPQFFKNINNYLKGESSVILIKLDNKIIAFELIIEDKSILRPLYLGLDYKMNEGLSLYFNSISQIIKHGIERNKKTIELGQTSYYPKLKVGARIEPLYFYIKFKNPLLQYLLKYPLKLLFPERTFKTKNIFKDQSLTI
jgi:predicted N-acyltransferase